MKFTDYFSHIYCINLLRRTDRWEECKIEFSKLNILDKVEKFDAVDGLAKYPDAKVVFIGPCVGKRKEVQDNPMIDYILTFEEIDTLFT